MGKIPEYPEENLYLFSGASKKKKITELFFSLIPHREEKNEGDKKLPNLWRTLSEFFVKRLLVIVLIT